MATIALPAFSPTTAFTNRAVSPRVRCSAPSPSVWSEPRERAFIIPGVNGSYRIKMKHSSAIPAWIKPTLSAFRDVQELPPNWDSYGAKPSETGLINASLSLLTQIMDDRFPPPAVVPLADGGLQFEWHRNNQDLEIVFPAEEPPTYYYQDRDGQQEEGPANATRRIVALLSQLA